MTERTVSLSGWGRYPRLDCAVHRPARTDQVAALAQSAPTSIARGNGRSYGDASLNEAATIVTTALDRFLSFDDEAGLLVCEAGTLLSDVIDALLPRGWFPPVTPGTKFVTIGGMIASDVHGKNHHGVGSFCNFVDWLDLALSDDRVVRCSPSILPDLFAATCGGMGLTGVILRACVRMKPVETSFIRQRTIRAPSFEAAIDIFERSADWTYSVAWIDCLATGASMGRSIVLLGEHARRDELDGGDPFARPTRRSRRLPIDFPKAAMGRLPIRLFNQLYYSAHRAGDAIVPFEPYFYPLDAVLDWNRMYGKSGFVQYQCVLPLAESRAGLRRMLQEIAAYGQASFLAVLKRLGSQSFGMLSFPREGFTLALDFPVRPEIWPLLARLDAICLEHGGRVYLAKDAGTGAAAFSAGYPQLDAFRAVRRKYAVDATVASHLSCRLDI